MSMEYSVIESDGNDFIILVNKHIAAGWQPLGGISASVIYRKKETMPRYWYVQAFTREITDESTAHN